MKATAAISDSYYCRQNNYLILPLAFNSYVMMFPVRSTAMPSSWSILGILWGP